MIVFHRIKGENMITYQDLCAGYSNYNKVLDEISDELRLAANRLCLYIEDDLGLVGKSWGRNDEGYTDAPYVMLGQGKNGSFTEEPFVRLPFYVDTKSIEFSILITLEKSPDTYPKASSWVDLRAYFEEKNIVLEIINTKGETPKKYISRPNSQDEFIDVTEAIKQSILKAFTL